MAVLACLLAGAHLSVACGSRTGLFVLEEAPATDAAPPPDTALEASEDVAVDTAADTSSEADVGVDALPMIDAAPLPDVTVVGCLDAGATEIYLVSAQNELMSFYPPTLDFAMIGTLACPANAMAAPNSMGVDRTGTAFVNFSDGSSSR